MPPAPSSAKDLSSSSKSISARSIQGEALDSLEEMLTEHFVEEVRRRDHDGDGRLDRREYGGSGEDFAILDRNRDGFVTARDMVQEVLARNDKLREMVQGPWAPVYNGLLALEEPSSSDIETAVYGLCREHKLSADAFLEEHSDLKSFYSRLAGLADRLGRFRQYHPVDLNG